MNPHAELYAAYCDSPSGVRVKGIVERCTGPKGGNVTIRWFGGSRSRLMTQEIREYGFIRIEEITLTGYLLTGKELLRRKNN